MPRKDLISYPMKVGYHKHSGMVAFILHRITAVLLVLYFVFHMLGSSSVCPFLSTVVQNKAAIAILIVSFVFHGLNGSRIMLMEFCQAAERENFKKVLLGMNVLVVVLSAAGLIRLFCF